MKTNVEDAKERIESKPTEGIDERQKSNQENNNEPMSFYFLSGRSHEVSQELGRKK